MRVRGFLCGGVRMRRLRGNPLFMGGRDGISALIVEGDLPGSLVISPHGTPRPGILWTVSRLCPVARPIRPSGYRIPAFIRTHTDECGKCPDEVDNQGNNAVLPGTALVSTLTTTSQSTLISSRDAHGQISDAGAWRTFEIYCTSKTTTHTACSPTAKTRWLSTMRSETA